MGLRAGHLQDMNNRMKQNRAMRPSKKSKFKSNNRGTIYSGNSSENNAPKYNTASK